MAQLSDYQRDVLTRTLLGEARGEGETGMEAVAHVINNRWQSGQFAGDPASVALQPYQFSTWNKGEGGNNPQQFSKSSRQYQEAASIVDRVFGGQSQDPTNGALFYHTPQVNPAWAGEVNKFGTTQLGNHIFYNGRPTPPGEIPNVVASRLDTTPQARNVPMPKPRPAVRRSAEESVRPYLTADMQVRGDNLPPLVPAQITPGLGSLTPDFFKTPAPPARLPELPPSNIATARTVNTGIERGQAASANVSPALTAMLPRYAVPASTVNQGLSNAYANVDPGLQRALEARNAPGVGQPPATRSVPSVPVSVASMGMTTERGAMPTRAGFLAEFGLSSPSERLSGPMPTTAMPGPNALPKGGELLTAGLYPMAPTAVPGAVPAVGTALDVVPNLPGFPPMPERRPIRAAMPTPMGQRPSLPMSRPVTGFPTAFAQRPAPTPTMRVTVNRAGSYSGGGTPGGSSGGSQPQTITGSSTGKTYNVGQQYQSGGYRFVATPDGFKNLGRV